MLDDDSSTHAAANRTDATRTAAAVPDTAAVPRWALGAGVLLLAGLAVAIYLGMASRTAAAANLAERTNEAAVPFVAVVKPTAGGQEVAIPLPGHTQAYREAPIYARTSGYVKKWYVDIGERVKQGQLLAEIETPEVDHALAATRAELQTAEANLRLAESTARRWQELRETNAVSAQETDEKISDQQAKLAAVASHKANVQRLTQLQAFQKVYAPFDGLITARHTDVGALIDAGANAPGREMFQLSSTDRLRVYINVPEAYAALARPGLEVPLSLDQEPDRKFKGRLVRTSKAIDATTHTLLTELEVDNTKGELLPGAFVTAQLPVTATGPSVTVPANTLLFRGEGPQAGVIRDGKARLVSVRIGRDYGTKVEILSGLTADDQLILDPPDGLADGTPVRISKPEAKPDGEPDAKPTAAPATTTAGS